MRIIFNLLDTGLGNNGGSLTIIKSANTLKDLGHDVIIVDSGRNQNTWEPLKCNHIIIDSPDKIPGGDVIIATGMRTLESTNNSKIEKKFHWIRGWETWVYPEERLIELFKESFTTKIVNSICLQKKLNKYGISSNIVRPGYDFDEIWYTGYRTLPDYGYVRFGGLFNRGKKRNGKRVEWIPYVVNNLFERERNNKLQLWMYGAEVVGPGGTFELNVYLGKMGYFSSPDKYEKNMIYNAIDIWLAPSELEGLHIPPAEAMLAKCAVIGTNAEMSGTEDYLIDGETGLVSENNIESFCECAFRLLKDKDLRIELGEAGRKKILSLGDRKDNMKNMIKVLEG